MANHFVSNKLDGSQAAAFTAKLKEQGEKEWGKLRIKKQNSNIAEKTK